jgi:hypothetical protein
MSRKKINSRRYKRKLLHIAKRGLQNKDKACIDHICRLEGAKEQEFTVFYTDFQNEY